MLTLGHSLLEAFQRKTLKEEALLIIRTDPGSETEAIDANLHYVEDKMKLMALPIRWNPRTSRIGRARSDGTA